MEVLFSKNRKEEKTLKTMFCVIKVIGSFYFLVCSAKVKLTVTVFIGFAL